MIVLLLGAPGAGKGTISSVLIEKHNFKQISTGDLLREEVASGSKLGKKLDAIMKSGELVSADLVNNLVKEKIAQYKKQGVNIVLDGYPRSLEQAQFLDKFEKIDKVVELVVDEAILLKRMTGRRVCPKCGAGYNVNTTKEFKPKVEGICDKCGAKLIQRKDDNAETIKSRLKVYEEKTKPLVGYYKKKGVLETFDGQKKSTDIIKKII